CSPGLKAFPSIANSNNFNRFELLMGALFFIPHGGLWSAYDVVLQRYPLWWKMSEPKSGSGRPGHGGGDFAGQIKNPRPQRGEEGVLACFFDKFASYRAAGANAGNEPERKGAAELPEIRKVDGTQ
ncbi:hypothetical protein B5G28_03110, partial [Faecalibacterium sp. An77]|uniref:hypothetical protein n=1 Tax=Faecalibacterium sp. An77 TaxID=1965655 RepID=UPI000B574577